LVVVLVELVILAEMVRTEPTVVLVVAVVKVADQQDSAETELQVKVETVGREAQQ
jgi:hypothetical protein